jgi:DNA-binding GntR family transcriptional regulator
MPGPASRSPRARKPENAASRPKVAVRTPPRATQGAAQRTSEERNVTERTYDALLGLILSGQLSPGDVLEERKLASALEVSRTPLRNAVSRLLGEEILARLSNGAAVVRETGVAEYLELLHVRRLLESEAAALAAGRVPGAKLGEMRRRVQRIIKEARAKKEEHWTLDDEVHDLIGECSGNKVLAQTIAAVRRRARLCNIERVPGRLVPASQEHLAIIDALSSGNGERAREAMIAHLNNVRRNFLCSLGLEQGGL